MTNLEIIFDDENQPKTQLRECKQLVLSAPTKKQNTASVTKAVFTESELDKLLQQSFDHDEYPDHKVIRYVLKTDNTFAFAHTGKARSTSSIPFHNEMAISCFAAGDLYFNKTTNGLEKIDNHSGHYKPAHSTLKFALARIVSLVTQQKIVLHNDCLSIKSYVFKPHPSNDFTVTADKVTRNQLINLCDQHPIYNFPQQYAIEANSVDKTTISMQPVDSVSFPSTPQSFVTSLSFSMNPSACAILLNLDSPLSTSQSALMSSSKNSFGGSIPLSFSSPLSTPRSIYPSYLPANETGLCFTELTSQTCHRSTSIPAKKDAAIRFRPISPINLFPQRITRKRALSHDITSDSDNDQSPLLRPIRQRQ